MKKFIYLAYLILCCIGTANAQDIVFNDTSFYGVLISSSTTSSIAKNSIGENIKIDDDNNGLISQQEAKNVYELEVINTSIIDMSGIEYFTNLTSLNCEQNSFRSIDVSALVNLTSLNVSENSDLVSIYAKNGINETIDLDSSNSSLAYICADESQILDLVSLNTELNFIVNSFCTLTPGGDYNTITGQILFDVNNDGSITPDAPFPFINAQCSINGKKLQTVSKTNGNYDFFIDEIGNFAVTPKFEDPSWFTVSPFFDNFVDTNNNISTHNFLIAPNGIHTDVEIAIRPIKYPNILLSTMEYEVVYKNKGNQIKPAGQININYNSLQFNLVSSTVALLNNGLGQLSRSYTNLMPFETRSFKVVMTTILPILLNTPVTIIATIDTAGEDPSTQNNNSFTYSKSVAVSSAINNLDCLQGNSLPTSEIGKYLHYAINFQNTGNQVAKNVTVQIDFDDSKYDISTMQILSSTHPLDLETNNSKATFSFRNTNLGGPGGSGGILLKIRTLPTLPAGSTVSTYAEIFYDYDTNTMPLELTTNNAPTTFQSLSVSINNFDNDIAIYPNPSSSIINIDSDVIISNIDLYDTSGRLLQTNISNSDKTSIDISQRENGVYFLKITSEKGQKVEQIIKK